MDFTRRDFLAATAAVAALQASPADAAPGWFDRPMRWAQLTLVENDPGTYDLNFWLDYFRRTHSDAACLSAGGCVAYYPTKVPMHYKTPPLTIKELDPVDDFLERKANVVHEPTNTLTLTPVKARPAVQIVVLNYK